MLNNAINIGITTNKIYNNRYKFFTKLQTERIQQNIVCSFHALTLLVGCQESIQSTCPVPRDVITLSL